MYTHVAVPPCGVSPCWGVAVPRRKRVQYADSGVASEPLCNTYATRRYTPPTDVYSV